jgi:hypothetical protein
MIVLDEQLLGYGLSAAITAWYRGTVTDITALRPGSLIPDDAIPELLRAARQPTFATINVDDFWRRLAPDRLFCILCFALSDKRVAELPGLLRQALPPALFTRAAAASEKLPKLPRTASSSTRRLRGLSKPWIGRAFLSRSGPSQLRPRPPDPLRPPRPPRCRRRCQEASGTLTRVAKNGSLGLGREMKTRQGRIAMPRGRFSGLTGPGAAGGWIGNILFL